MQVGFSILHIQKIMNTLHHWMRTACAALVV